MPCSGASSSVYRGCRCHRIPAAGIPAQRPVKPLACCCSQGQPLAFQRGPAVVLSPRGESDNTGTKTLPEPALGPAQPTPGWLGRGGHHLPFIDGETEAPRGHTAPDPTLPTPPQSLYHLGCKSPRLEQGEGHAGKGDKGPLWPHNGDNQSQMMGTEPQEQLPLHNGEPVPLGHNSTLCWGLLSLHRMGQDRAMAACAWPRSRGQGRASRHMGQTAHSQGAMWKVSLGPNTPPSGACHHA